MGELLAPGWLLEVCKAAGGPLGGLETFNGVWSALACTAEFLGQFQDSAVLKAKNSWHAVVGAFCNIATVSVLVQELNLH